MPKALSSVDDLLTQKATVFARVQSWDAEQAEVYGNETTIYSNEPCVLIPMTPDRSAMAGLNFGQRGYLALFRPTKYITRSSTGQAYQDVRIRVSGVDYITLGPQQRFGEDFGIDDMDHVEVPVARRDSA